jgi:hypothetical protein
MENEVEGDGSHCAGNRARPVLGVAKLAALAELHSGYQGTKCAPA